MNTATASKSFLYVPRINGNFLLSETEIFPIHQTLLYLSEMAFAYLALDFNRSDGRTSES